MVLFFQKQKESQLCHKIRPVNHSRIRLKLCFRNKIITNFEIEYRKYVL